MADWDHYGIQRRVAGKHDYRLEGVSDILSHARGATVLDLGCNRGMVGMEFARHDARVIHVFDVDEESIKVARSIFADCRHVQDYKFEVVDLCGGDNALRVAFGSLNYDVVLVLATLHKLRKQVKSEEQLRLFCTSLADRTAKYFVWRGTEDQEEANQVEMDMLDLHLLGLKRVHTSWLSSLGPAAIWKRA